MQSIRARFLATVVLSTVLALAMAAWIFIELFSLSYQRRVDLELTALVNQITGSLEFDQSGPLLTPTLFGDPRFEQAYRGTYWQIVDVENDLRLQPRQVPER